jgi:hypothetical protein
VIRPTASRLSAIQRIYHSNKTSSATAQTLVTAGWSGPARPLSGGTVLRLRGQPEWPIRDSNLAVPGIYHLTMRDQEFDDHDDDGKGPTDH